LLIEFAGTLLLVSHDRSFIDNVVTSTLVFEGHGKIQTYAGGYQDWLLQRRQPDPAQLVTRSEKTETRSVQTKPPVRARKLSYNEQRELEQLPARIEHLESNMEQLQSLTSQPDFYQGNPAEIKATLARLEDIQQLLDAAYTRWGELDGI
jgi:ATP-binding cassette subfamily F protein uup